MIDQCVEPLIPFGLIPPEAAPGRRAGTRIHRVTLSKWATDGLLEVVLESVVVGRQRCTSIAALDRFYSRVAEAKAAARKRRNRAFIRPERQSV